jgi:hypothetical protein
MLRHWQLGFALLWASLLGVALTRDWLFTEETLDRLPIRDWRMAMLISGLMFAWNLARWWQAFSHRRTARLRTPLQPKPGANTGYEYNPELDFFKPNEPPTTT